MEMFIFTHAVKFISSSELKWMMLHIEMCYLEHCRGYGGLKKCDYFVYEVPCFDILTLFVSCVNFIAF